MCWRAKPRDFLNRRCCANLTLAIICVKRLVGLFSVPMKKAAPCCYVDGPSEQSEYELFNGDLDRLMPHIEACMNRVPAFAEVGVKTVYNGAIAIHTRWQPHCWPSLGLKNFWLNEGHSFGITAAGGAGWQLAEWIVDGEPTVDMMGVDPRRFGPYASPAVICAAKTKKPMTMCLKTTTQMKSAVLRGR